MPIPRIFISHSSADAPEFVLGLEAALTAAGFHVLLDRTRRTAGDAWRNEIYTWIARAHGAVVVFSEAALRSPWVKFELAALAPRRWLDGRFKFVPVIVRPVTVAALSGSDFEPYDLAELQAEAVDAGTPGAWDRVVDAFRPLLTSFSDTPVDRLETTVARELPSDVDVLERTALLLEAAHDAHESPSDPGPVARSLFHAAVEKVRDALAEIAAARISRSQIRKIVEIVVPFWIDPQAIVELAREAAAPAGPHRILLLNSRQPFVGKLYAQRAALQYPLKWEVVPVTNSGGDDLVGSVVAELRNHFRQFNPLLDGMPNEDVDADIENTASIDPVIVIIGGDATAAHLAELRRRYPHCIFLAMVGADVPDETVRSAHEMIVLAPQMPPEREQALRTHYLACYRLVSNITA